MFVNQPLDEIAGLVDALGVTHVQLHGDEGPSFCSAVAQRTGAKVIKAVRDRARLRPAGPRALPHRPAPARHRRRRPVRRHRPHVGLEPARAAPREGPVPALRRADGGQRRRGDRRRAAVGRRRRVGRRGVAGDQGSGEAAKRSSPRSRASMSAIEHRFGPYGGQFVPETLVPALEELEAAWLDGARRPGLPARVPGAAEGLRRPSVAALPRGAPVRGRRPRRLSQARGPQPHRRAQDQQRDRPVPAGQAARQAPDHRRDRRRPARRRDRHRVRAARPRVHRLHGHRGHAPPAAQRAPDGAAGREDGAGRRRHRDAQGGDQRRDPRLDDDASRRRTTCSARAPARRRSRRWCATCSA